MYRKMGLKRSHAKVGIALCKSTALMNRWSRTHSWVDRARAWDRHLDQATTQSAIEGAVADARERHLDLSRSIQELVRKRLETLQPDDVTPAMLDRLLKVAYELELLSLGEPTQATKVTGIEGGDTAVGIVIDWHESDKSPENLPE